MEPVSSRRRIQAIKDDEKRAKVEQILSLLTFDNAKIERMIKVFENEIKLANSTDENLRKQTDLFWENTFVRRLLDGTENGTFIGLDLGGTNFRIVKVDMKNGKDTTITKYYHLEKGLLNGSCSVMFDYIAKCMAEFLSEGTYPTGQAIPTGFTFSFPSTQKSLKHSSITTWTKNITCTNGPGLDSVVLLEEAIKRRGVVINCEFGGFGDNGCLDFLKTEIDREVDKYSNHPTSFTFEKFFSGLYLGELVRLFLVKLTTAGVLFQGKCSEKLMTRWNFSTNNVTKIERDTGDDNTNTLSVLKEMDLLEFCIDEDIALTREVCELVSQRGAYIVATAMVVLLNHIDLPEVTIAIDGSLYEHHPKYHQHMMDIVQKWRPQTKTTMKLIKDGSGQGGALVAAIQQKRAHGS